MDITKQFNNPSNQLSEELIEPNVDQYIEWDLELTKNISIHNAYHNIDDSPIITN